MTGYDPISEVSCRDLCLSLNVNTDRHWGEVNDFACDCYQAGLMAGRAERNAEVGALERRIAELEAEMENLRHTGDIAPLPFTKPCQTEHLGLVEPDRNGLVRGDDFSCFLGLRFSEMVRESSPGDELEFICADGLRWTASIGYLVEFRNVWDSGERTFSVRRGWF
jgi:hypothetical protein